MFGLINTLKTTALITSRHICKRTFLSPAYYCNEVWTHRLNDPMFGRVKLDDLYHELDQRFQRTGVISAVDVDIFVNAVNDEIYLDELLDITHKLRLSAETSNTLSSTPHAVVRSLLDFNRKEDLLNALDDRLNYGIFVDYFTANILMDKLYKEKDFTGGARVASQLMLQEENGHSISTNLGLLHCYNFLLNPVGWPEPVVPEEPEEEVKIRVKYLRNPYDDDHFDLKEPLKIIGKTLVTFTKSPKDTLEKSLHLLGWSLYGKQDKVTKLIETYTKNNEKVFEEILKLVPEDAKELFQKLQTEAGSIINLLEDRVKKSERELAEKDIAAQCELYSQWEVERKNALQRQKERLLHAQRIEQIEIKQKELELKEEKLWFFENEENIELEIEQKTSTIRKQPEDKKQTIQKIDENYIPPEIKRNLS